MANSDDSPTADSTHKKDFLKSYKYEFRVFYSSVDFWLFFILLDSRECNQMH